MTTKTTITAMSAILALSMLTIALPQEADAATLDSNGEYTHSFALFLYSNGDLLPEASSTITLCGESNKVYFKADQSQSKLWVKWEGQTNITCGSTNYTFSSGDVFVDEYDGAPDGKVDEYNAMVAADSLGWVQETTPNLDASDFIIAQFVFKYT